MERRSTLWPECTEILKSVSRNVAVYDVSGWTQTTRTAAVVTKDIVAKMWLKSTAGAVWSKSDFDPCSCCKTRQTDICRPIKCSWLKRERRVMKCAQPYVKKLTAKKFPAFYGTRGFINMFAASWLLLLSLLGTISSITLHLRSAIFILF
jgi:hypothetical protein